MLVAKRDLEDDPEQGAVRERRQGEGNRVGREAAVSPRRPPRPEEDDDDHHEERRPGERPEREAARVERDDVDRDEDDERPGDPIGRHRG